MPDDVMIATAADLRAAVDNALRRCGMTFDQLAAEARSGDFSSMRARLAWVAIGDLHDVDIEAEYGEREGT